MGARRIEALVAGLPPGSALARSLDEPTRAGWGYGEELLATLIEVVDVGNRNFLAANGVKRGQLPKAIDIPRPGRPKPEPRRKATSSDLRRMFGGQAITPRKGGHK